MYCLSTKRIAIVMKYCENMYEFDNVIKYKHTI